MRRCLYGWREGSYNFKTKLSKVEADKMSQMLEDCNKTKPREIQRAIRGLKFLEFWKGSEYRVFLLYVGVIVLKDFLSVEVYDHFLMLSSAVTILSCKEYFKYIDVADQLIKDYIETFIDIYGIDSISSNMHNLCHVVDDVKKFGPLPGISSYPFENYLGSLKSLVRHGNKPLSQISRRVTELSKLNHLNKSTTSSFPILQNEILNKIHELPMCTSIFEKILLADDFSLSSDKKNKYFMTKCGQIVSMINATCFNNIIHIYGHVIKNKTDFFLKPF